MKPSVLRCPSCGAVSETPASPEPVPCVYCKAALHPARCPWCFTWAFSESALCPGCDAKAPRDADYALSCPDCRVPLNGRESDGARLDGCPKCGGVWADHASLGKFCSERSKEAELLGADFLPPLPKPSPRAASPVRYRPCARCGELMNRVNFARASGVIADVCKAHGSWFDLDELADIAAFVRAGGLEKARKSELLSLIGERPARFIPPLTSVPTPLVAFSMPKADSTPLVDVLAAAAELLRSFLR